MRISVEINGRAYEGDVEPRELLSDFIRHGAGLTGTKVGCEQGVVTLRDPAANGSSRDS